MVKRYVTQAKEIRIVIKKFILPDWLQEVFKSDEGECGWMCMGDFTGYSLPPLNVSRGYGNVLFIKGDLTLILNAEGELMFQLPGNSRDYDFITGYEKNGGSIIEGIKKQIEPIQQFFEWGPGAIEYKRTLLKEVRNIVPGWKIIEDKTMISLSPRMIDDIRGFANLLIDNERAFPVIKGEMGVRSAKEVLYLACDEEDLLWDFREKRKQETISILETAGFPAKQICKESDWTSFEEDRIKRHKELIFFACLQRVEIPGLAKDSSMSNYYNWIQDRMSVCEDGAPLSFCSDYRKIHLGSSGLLKLDLYGRVYVQVDEFLYACKTIGQEKVLSQIKEDAALIPALLEWAVPISEKRKREDAAINEKKFNELKELLPNWRLGSCRAVSEEELREVKELIALAEREEISLGEKISYAHADIDLRDRLREENLPAIETWEEGEKQRKNEEVLSLLKPLLQ